MCNTDVQIVLSVDIEIQLDGLPILGLYKPFCFNADQFSSILLI